MYVFHISATMSRQGGQVQLEQSDIYLALNMAKMQNAGSSGATIADINYVMKEHSTEVREGKTREVEFPGNRIVKSSMK
jgi:hypothetical protein